MKKIMLIAGLGFVLLALAGQAEASVAAAAQTLSEGAVEFPLGLVKLVGGAVWTIGEVIILPFRILFG